MSECKSKLQTSKDEILCSVCGKNTNPCNVLQDYHIEIIKTLNKDPEFMNKRILPSALIELIPFNARICKTCVTFYKLKFPKVKPSRCFFCEKPLLPDERADRVKMKDAVPYVKSIPIYHNLLIRTNDITLDPHACRSCSDKLRFFKKHQAKTSEKPTKEKASQRPIEEKPTDKHVDLASESDAKFRTPSPKKGKSTVAKPVNQLVLDKNKIIKGKIIGSGNFGDVAEGTYEGQRVALKNPKRMSIIKFKNEIDLLSTLKHPNIIPFIGEYTSDDNLPVMVMPLLKTDLFEVLYEQKALSENKFLSEELLLKGTLLSGEARVRLMIDVTQGLLYLHENGVIHRDAKLENVFIDVKDGDITAMIGDFGVSKRLLPLKPGEIRAQLTPIGVGEFPPPELKSGKYDFKLDVFNLGQIMWRTWTLITNSGVEPSGYIAGAPTALNELIRRCQLKKIPDNRPTAQEVLAELQIILKKLQDKEEKAKLKAEKVVTAPMRKRKIEPTDPVEGMTYQTRLRSNKQKCN
eukprot:TRINITY_DN114_c0_g1_i3.p1 TRINITY_DN114_c0_g1~~TRINITY_DN114_c0_g1_i3.p1  ORF type:complete len:520 (-),score=68.11 TRINITY_DN114_c0_g1_i3:99-1658(-)